MDNQKKYFEGLDNLRAIGALTVLTAHIELTKSDFKISNLMEANYFKYTSGHLGLILFYVLSGFLITYILLREKSQTDTISIGNFYFRRILRIAPIYYITTIFLFFILPRIVHLNYFGKIPLDAESINYYPLAIYLLLAPNLMVFGINGIGGGYHLGSIGVEEQFYLIWPHLIKRIKNLFLVLCLIIFVIPLLPHLCDFWAFHYFKETTNQFKFLKSLGLFFQYFKINCMALGALFAYLSYNNNILFRRIIYNKIIQFAALSFGFGGWIIGFHLNFFTDEFYSLWFGVIISNLAFNEKKVFALNSSILNYVGKISYGIYVYHWLVIYVILQMIYPLKHNMTVFNTLLYCLTILITILLAHVSYFYFEVKFLKLKKS